MLLTDSRDSTRKKWGYLSVFFFFFFRKYENCKKQEETNPVVSCLRLAPE